MRFAIPSSCGSFIHNTLPVLTGAPASQFAVRTPKVLRTIARAWVTDPCLPLATPGGGRGESSDRDESRPPFACRHRPLEKRGEQMVAAGLCACRRKLLVNLRIPQR